MILDTGLKQTFILNEEIGPMTEELKDVRPGLYFIKDKNILKSDLGTIIQCYNIGLLFLSQT